MLSSFESPAPSQQPTLPTGFSFWPAGKLQGVLWKDLLLWPGVLFFLEVSTLIENS